MLSQICITMYFNNIIPPTKLQHIYISHFSSNQCLFSSVGSSVTKIVNNATKYQLRKRKRAFLHYKERHAVRRCFLLYKRYIPFTLYIPLYIYTFPYTFQPCKKRRIMSQKDREYKVHVSITISIYIHALKEFKLQYIVNCM